MPQQTTVVGLFAGISVAEEVAKLLQRYGIASSRLTTHMRVTSPCALADARETVAVDLGSDDDREPFGWDLAARLGGTVVKVDVPATLDADTVELLMRSRGALRIRRTC